MPPESTDVTSRTDEASRRPPGPVSVLDVRPALARGEEPFRMIMDAVDSLPDGTALELRSPFEPVPLHGVLAKKGFAHSVSQAAPDDWTTWYWRQ